MPSVNAFAAVSATAPLQPIIIERREVGPRDVLIDIKYTGICHSDIHEVRGDWGPCPYPLAPGHEITGVVAAVGAEVTRFAAGDRVGAGCLVGSCGKCDACLRGQEQYCSVKAIWTYGDTDVDGTVTQGGYATQIVVTDRFVLHVPDALPLDTAAPLLCAGITTYAPLRRWGLGPGKKVAVVGLGGLGHIAVKIAHALGAEVTVLSQTLSKKEAGLALGAVDYRATGDPATFQELAGAFDLILSTVSAPLPMDSYLSMLTVGGVMVNVGAAPEESGMHLRLLNRQRILTGSLIGGIAETQQMLDFCGEHGIGAEVEVIAAEQINEAYERVLASDVRYRFVIDVATLA
ncbi:NAD(P)-dependent alcohol dehydrogenase [Catenulispora pinisilvae]|uniref:NAD(P)-dependent alcohol dehydrogenase n=1 Tax=Catenulispora pinisilvae TaxID=2705253 RepID=UPI0018916D1D|nr:NAD(P)-dependent alcohol dehydrogenase [Catenulispora pinisilvae]